MALEVVLRDGTPAMIWPLLPSDREALRHGYSSLSPQSQHHRFLSAVRTLSDDALARLVDDVDGVNHIALGLVALPADGPDAPAGVARMIRYEDRPGAVDVAVTVADEWQGRGVATALLDALIRDRPEGVDRIETQVAADNPASIAMLARLGTLQAALPVGGVYDVTVLLPPPSSG